MHIARVMQVVTILMATLAATAIAQEETPGGIAWQTDVDAAWRETAETGQPLLLYVTMDGCHFCEKMKDETYRDAGVMRDVASGFVPASFVAREHPKLIRKLQIRNFPTTVVITADGRVQDKITGYVAPRQFRHRLAAARVARAESERR